MLSAFRYTESTGIDIATAHRVRTVAHPKAEEEDLPVVDRKQMACQVLGRRSHSVEQEAGHILRSFHGSEEACCCSHKERRSEEARHIVVDHRTAAEGDSRPAEGKTVGCIEADHMRAATSNLLAVDTPDAAPHHTLIDLDSLRRT